MPLEIQKAIRDFTLLILHGSEEHRLWLKEACEAYCNNQPLPEPRGLNNGTN